MTNDISTNPIPRRFDEIERLFFYGNHVWVKIPEVLDAKTNRNCNAYCFEQERLDYFDSSYCVADPKSANMKVEF